MTSDNCKPDENDVLFSADRFDLNDETVWQPIILTSAEQDRETVYFLALDGLTTDGAHHKQWYLEQILFAVSAMTLEDLKTVFADYKPGIKP